VSRQRQNQRTGLVIRSDSLIYETLTPSQPLERYLVFSTLTDEQPLCVCFARDAHHALLTARKFLNLSASCCAVPERSTLGGAR